MHEELETVVVEFDEDSGVGRLTMNRPEKLNAMNLQMRADLAAGLERIGEFDDEADGVAVRVVVLEGAGDSFCAGADATEFSGGGGPSLSTRGFRDEMEEFPAPIVAKIRGYCLGGGFETALACDLRLAAEDASVGFPEVDLGLLPGAGGVHYVAELANSTVAKELAMTGDHVPAKRARELGLVNRVYGDEEFDEAVEEFVEELAGQAPLAVRAIKDTGTRSRDVDISQGVAYDRRTFSVLLDTEDHEEGARAFADDEYEPEFEGK